MQDINDLIPGETITFTVDNISSQSFPAGNVLDGVQDTFGFPNLDLIAREAGEIDVTADEILSVYSPESVDIEAITSSIGETATLESIVTETYRGSDDGRNLLDVVLPEGESFNELIETVPDGQQYDVSQFFNSLFPSTDEQLDTRGTLEALGLEFSIDSVSDLDGFKFPDFSSESFLNNISSSTDLNQDVVLTEFFTDAPVSPAGIVQFSKGPTPETLLSSFGEEDGTLAETAKLEDILRVSAPGQVNLEDLLEGVLEPKDEESLQALRESVLNSTDVDISQTVASNYSDEELQQEVKIAGTLTSLYGEEFGKRAKNFTEVDRLLLPGPKSDYDIQLLEADDGQVYTLISEFTTLGGSGSTNFPVPIPNINLSVPSLNTGLDTVAVVEGDFKNSSAILFNQ